MISPGEPLTPELLSAIVEQASDGVFVTDSELRIEWVNATACSLLALERDQLVGRRISELLDPEDISGAPLRRDDLVAGRPTMTLRRFRTGDGRTCVLEVSAKAVGGGRVLGLARDATARLQAQEMAARSAASFRTLIEASPDGVVVHREGTIVYVNSACARLLGAAAPADLLGTPLIDIVDPVDKAKVGGRIGALLAGAPNTPFVDMRLLRRDGSTVVASAGAVRVLFEGELSIVAVLRDVTAQRKWQQKVAQTDRMAMLGTLAAGVAHEVNNPLAYVILNLNAIVRLAGEGDAAALAAIAEHGELALEGSQRVARIVRDLRQLSRDDGDPRAPVDIRRGVELAVSTASHLLRHRARVVLDLGDPPLVLASEGRLAQIFVNLLVNAAHAIPEGRREQNEIQITATCEADNVLIAVRDTGVGIPEADLKRIFEPFFTTKAAGEGSGLGLAICQNLVQALEGRLLVTSRVGEGSTFTVVLPRARGASSAPPADPPPSQRGEVLT